MPVLTFGSSLKYFMSCLGTCMCVWRFVWVLLCVFDVLSGQLYVCAYTIYTDIIISTHTPKIRQDTKHKNTPKSGTQQTTKSKTQRLQECNLACVTKLHKPHFWNLNPTAHTHPSTTASCCPPYLFTFSSVFHPALLCFRSKQNGGEGRYKRQPNSTLTIGVRDA